MRGGTKYKRRWKLKRLNGEPEGGGLGHWGGLSKPARELLSCIREEANGQAGGWNRRVFVCFRVPANPWAVWARPVAMKPQGELPQRDPRGRRCWKA